MPFWPYEKLKQQCGEAYLLAIDGAVVGTDDNVLDTVELEAAGTETVRVLEALDELLDFGRLQLQGEAGKQTTYLQSGRGCPCAAVEAMNGALRYFASSDQVVVDISLPAHFVRFLTCVDCVVL